MSLQALLFDVDGTLADTEAHGHLPAYNRAFRELELDWEWSPKLYRELLNVPSGRERIAHYIERYKPDLGKHNEAAQSDRSAWVKTVHEHKSRHFQERLQNGQVPLRAGVKRLFAQAHAADLRIAIVTNASAATLEPFLAYALGEELCSYIDAVVSGEQAQRRKPAPDVYLKACRALNCKPASCVAIEDSAMGLDAAYHAGIPTVVTLNADTRAESLAHASLIVDSLGEPGEPIQVIRSSIPGTPEYIDLDILRRLQREFVHTAPAADG